MRLTANLPRNLPVKKNCKSVKIRQNFGHESVDPFLAHPVCGINSLMHFHHMFTMLPLYLVKFVGLGVILLLSLFPGKTTA